MFHRSYSPRGYIHSSLHDAAQRNDRHINGAGGGAVDNDGYYPSENNGFNDDRESHDDGSERVKEGDSAHNTDCDRENRGASSKSDAEKIGDDGAAAIVDCYILVADVASWEYRRESASEIEASAYHPTRRQQRQRRGEASSGKRADGTEKQSHNDGRKRRVGTSNAFDEGRVGKDGSAAK